MKEIYTDKGYSDEDAESLVNLLAKNKEFFVDHMMVHELGIMPPDKDDDPKKKGLYI